ncbi:neutral zinc metallopeptidase [Cellulophaga baltica]|uniref:KPN_02809 family neutral zinc metallopeptidase n=1 Tax=Cellulophaga TaxID=104264 RepID=UPI00051D374E|nr:MULTISPECIES: neutral zinc metallopeptidase [Cellulophaga]KGK29456.1 flagellar biosynthesis anti-sigma factor FlgM [Cellulophaga sp. E6(2014)]MCR1026102.1 neutral zinc metallopeptidase [Cellulophaga baltica]
MKWQGRRKSANVEDRRGQSNSGGSGFNPMLLAPLLKFVFSKTGLIIVGIVLITSLVFGYNPLNLVTNFFTGTTSQSISQEQYDGSPEENEQAQFSATILASTEDVWNGVLDNYKEPTLVLYSGSVTSACGSASSATGPFYCPGDEKLYLDLSFFKDMENQMNAPGDFAQAYVIAHEVGHHIQKLSGTMDKVNRLRGQISDKEFNEYSVRLELQADFLAGVWANHAQRTTKIMESGDFEEAMNAANAIGDDRLQRQSTGRVVPDSFTHGTSEQRMRWFKKGFDTGDISKGDTFSATSL